MIAFFVSTPYHIFNCINLKVSFYPNEDAVLFILQNGSTDVSIVENTRRSGIFRDIEYVKEPKSCSAPFPFLKSYLLPNKKKAGLIFSETYNEVFFTSNGPVADFAYTHMRKKNPNLKISYFEEGLSDYLYSPRPDDIRRMRIIFRFGYLDAYRNLSNFYVYEPTLLCANTDQPVAALPKITPDTYRAIKSAFAVERTEIPDDCRLVYLDQPFMAQFGFDFDDRHLLSVIERVIPHENIYVKLHPGDTDVSRYEGYKIFPQQPYPWEVILGEMDLHNVILVAANSTAAISPKCVFGVETKAVFTYGMYPDLPYPGAEEQTDYFARLKGLYNDRSRFAMPTTDAELIDALKKMR